jgi:YidC/Oxa1 family membrane protein insertase
MFYKVAAGLCVYFIASSLWGLAERQLLPKKKTGPGVPTSPTATNNGAAQNLAAQKGKWKNSKKEKDKEEAPSTIGKLKALWREILKQAEKK